MESTYSPSTLARLDALIDAPDTGSERVAVFDADGTLWADDVGEDFFRWQLAERKLDLDYRQDPWGQYKALCKRHKSVGYGSLGPIMKGVREAELIAWAEAFVDEHYKRRIFRAQAGLVERLHEAGWAVWVVSASNRWIAAAGARHLGIGRERVVGVDVVVEDGVLTGTMIEPVPCYAGKAALIESRIGVKPLICGGNAMTDLEMLVVATRLTIVINPDEVLRGVAQARGWAVEQWS